MCFKNRFWILSLSLRLIKQQHDRSNIICGKTKELSWIRSCAPEVVHVIVIHCCTFCAILGGEMMKIRGQFSLDMISLSTFLMASRLSIIGYIGKASEAIVCTHWAFCLTSLFTKYSLNQLLFLIFELFRQHSEIKSLSLLQPRFTRSFTT